MKRIFFYSMLVSTSLFSCVGSEDEVLDKNVNVAEMTKSENFAPDILKPSTLISLSFIRTLFKISKDEFIDFSDQDGRCTYDFVVDNKSYHIDLMFYFPGEMDANKATKMFDQLTTKYTSESDAPQKLEGVADLAMWSLIGGGQLIAKYKNEVIILNMSMVDLSSMKNLGSSDKSYQAILVEKGKKIIAQVINKLEQTN